MRRETLDAMWEAVSARKSVLLPFLNRKASAFGLDTPTWYDVTAPYPVEGDDADLPWGTACNLIILQLDNGFLPIYQR